MIILAQEIYTFSFQALSIANDILKWKSERAGGFGNDAAFFIGFLTTYNAVISARHIN